MNIKDYISSGILEAYLLDQLNAEERADVERNISIYPELKAELQALEETQEAFLMASAVRPNASVKEKIFQHINDRESKGTIALPAADEANPWKYAAAASIALAVISSFLAFNYWSKWKDSSSELNNLIAQNQRIAQDYNQVNQRLDRMENDLRVMDNPAFKKVVLKGTPNAPASLASVYWNQETNEVFLKIQQMKELSKDQQYQLWAIIDGKPVSAGVFDFNAEGMVKMKGIGPEASMFAVTIEPQGGKSSPTLETMQVAGEVIKG